jgi:prophage tail gpP-like protein
VASLETKNVEADMTAKAVDTAMVNDLKLFRPRIIVSTQTRPKKPGETVGFAQLMANWEMARRIGRSQAVQITCDSWRDSAGKLWQPNRLANVHIPALKLVNQDWLISTVTFRNDQSGTHADLVLMPPLAFSVQPSTLHLWDAEIAHVLQSQQSAP